MYIWCREIDRVVRYIYTRYIIIFTILELHSKRKFSCIVIPAELLLHLCYMHHEITSPYLGYISVNVNLASFMT